MLSFLTKTETFILSLLVGILLGMLSITLFKISLDVKEIQNTIATSCPGSKPLKINVSFLGNISQIKCENTQQPYHNY